jgi:hypothetical protein
LTLNFEYGSGTVNSSLSGLLVSNFRLSPACVDISDVVLDNEESAEAFARMVSIIFFYFTFFLVAAGDWFGSQHMGPHSPREAPHVCTV